LITTAVGCLLLVESAVSLPGPVTLVSGLAAVFFATGFSLVCALSLDLRLAATEWLVASVGASLALATCLAVLLAATPWGLTRVSYAVTLGAGILALAAVAAAGVVFVRPTASGVQRPRAVTGQTGRH
jgi:uncharacterized membrane protein